ncbi:DNA mismatch endonuclease Vsr [Rhodococcus hoagii]|nr:DNA mismatch endonuclease Vsr [Prescottella equi]NKT03115.1 DNA mismatch endonuclease Vsr [Prescottella equi]
MSDGVDDGPVSASTPAAGYQLTPGRSRNMSAIKRTGTKPETELRTALHARGLRYRKDFPLRIEGRLVRPDIAFTKRKVAVFVDGCFWHSCPEHGRHPGVNKEYWSPKLRRNAERDLEQTRLLESAGWRVVRLWEHVPLDDAIVTVIAALLAKE